MNRKPCPLCLTSHEGACKDGDLLAARWFLSVNGYFYGGCGDVVCAYAKRDPVYCVKRSGLSFFVRQDGSVFQLNPDDPMWNANNTLTDWDKSG